VILSGDRFCNTSQVAYLHICLCDAFQVTISFSRACSGGERNSDGQPGRGGGGVGGLVGYAVALERGPCEPQVDCREENQRQKEVEDIGGKEEGEAGEGDAQGEDGGAASLVEIVKIGGVEIELKVAPAEGPSGKAGVGVGGGVGGGDDSTDVPGQGEVDAGEGSYGSQMRKESSI